MLLEGTRRPGKGDRELTLDLLVGRLLRPHPGATWISSRPSGDRPAASHEREGRSPPNRHAAVKQVVTMGLRRTQCLKDYTLTKQGVKLGCGTGQEKGMGGRGNKRRAERGREQNQDGALGAEASLFYSLSWPQRHHATITSEWADPSHHNCVLSRGTAIT